MKTNIAAILGVIATNALFHPTLEVTNYPDAETNMAFELTNNAYFMAVTTSTVYTATCMSFNLDCGGSINISTRDGGVSLTGCATNMDVAASNFWVAVTKAFPDIKEQIKEGILQSGQVCEKHGHSWKDGCGIVGCLVLHSAPMRHCMVCGTVQTLTIGEWKEGM